MGARRFRKKPVVVEALRLPRFEDANSAARYVDQCIGIARWCGGRSFMMNADDEERDGVRGPHMIIPTTEGDMIASPGDWIIKGVEEEFYPCKPSVFEATYEEVTE